jgi:hypothetical protein
MGPEFCAALIKLTLAPHFPLCYNVHIEGICQNRKGAEKSLRLPNALGQNSYGFKAGRFGYAPSLSRRSGMGAAGWPRALAVGTAVKKHISLAHPGLKEVNVWAQTLQMSSLALLP